MFPYYSDISRRISRDRVIFLAACAWIIVDNSNKNKRRRSEGFIRYPQSQIPLTRSCSYQEIFSLDTAVICGHTFNLFLRFGEDKKLGEETRSRIYHLIWFHFDNNTRLENKRPAEKKRTPSTEHPETTVGMPALTIHSNPPRVFNSLIKN